MLTMRKARRLYRAACTRLISFRDPDGKVLEVFRARRPGCASFRAWIRAEHAESPILFASPKLTAILGV